MCVYGGSMWVSKSEKKRESVCSGPAQLPGEKKNCSGADSGLSLSGNAL